MHKIQFEDLCEVITDKLVAKIPSAYSGKIVKLNFKNDEICQVGQSLLDLEVGDDVKVKEEAVESKEEHAPEPPKAEAPKPEPKPEPKSERKHEAPASGQVLATPAVRGLATEMGIDLTKVTPTGKGGRITKSDILKYAEGKKAEPSTQATPFSPPKAPAVALQHDVTIKLDGLTKAMTREVTDSRLIPNDNMLELISLETINRVRKAYEKAYKKEISYGPFFIKALSWAMVQYPSLNGLTTANVDSDGYILNYIEKADHNFGLTIDTPSGCVTPCIKSVQKKSIYQINAEVCSLIDKANKGILSQEELTGATFTFTDVSKYGGSTGIPLIFRPQVAIGAIYKPRTVANYIKKPEGGIDVKPMEVIGFSVTSDHRIVDGATGAKFIGLVKNYIENLDKFLLTLK